MKKFYLHDGAKNVGPFDRNELQEKKITKETNVWHEDYIDWKKAGDINELKPIFDPDFLSYNTVQHRKKLKKDILYIYVLIAIALFTLFAIGGILIIKDYL